jgi:hypothetical protein
MSGRNLKDLRVFIVEDESMVSMLIEDRLADMGCAVAGVASNVEEAGRNSPRCRSMPQF